MGQIGKLFLLLRTVRYLKAEQIVYQVKNRVIKPGNLQKYLPTGYSVNVLKFSAYPVRKKEISGDATFTFLNLSKHFGSKIDWGFAEYGKLWNYNLQYFNFLNQEDVSVDRKIELLRDIYTNLASGQIKLEPYPVSLRSMNVIRFLSGEQGRQNAYPDICRYLHAELDYLHRNYEYHILGNHLLENAFCMKMGSCFFGRDDWSNRSDDVLSKQLKEQILKDGAHFERSPMYHQIILYRVLEAIDYLSPLQHDLSDYLNHVALKMLGWLREITFRNGDIPHMNDSAPGISFSSQQLFSNAQAIGIKEPESKIQLGESGYRKFSEGPFEMVVDVEGIEPSYQPGHAHSDHLSFVLYINSSPFIVDPGISTYNIGERRLWERSSLAHNSVTISGQNVSEVWGGFRVGRRPHVEIINEDSNSVVAKEVYQIGPGKIQHTRSFELKENKILISDEINSTLATARLHLHPSISILNLSEDLSFSNGARIFFDNIRSVKIEEYQYNEAYNFMTSAKVIVIIFEKFFTCEISSMNEENTLSNLLL